MLQFETWGRLTVKLLEDLRRQAGLKPQNISDDQAWFWTEEWQKGEREVDEALAQESLPENRALANGVYMSLSFILRSGVIVVLGALGDLFGLRLAFTASAVIPLLGLPLIFLLPGKRPRHSLER